MRRMGTALLLLVAGGALPARADTELAVGPDIQLNKGHADEGGTIGTGFLVRALRSRTASHAMGLSLEGLWLIPTGDAASAAVARQQDLLFINRVRPPVGRTETLALDVGLGVTHFSATRDTYHPALQLGISIAGRFAGPLRFELGARLAMMANLFYGDMTDPHELPPTAAWRFAGVISTNL